MTARRGHRRHHRSVEIFPSKGKEITSGQLNSLVEAATKFGVKVSSDSPVTHGSNMLPTEINSKKNKKGESMDLSKAFVESKKSQLIHCTQYLTWLPTTINGRSLSQTVL